MGAKQSKLQRWVPMHSMGLWFWRQRNYTKTQTQTRTPLSERNVLGCLSLTWWWTNSQIQFQPSDCSWVLIQHRWFLMQFPDAHKWLGKRIFWKRKLAYANCLLQIATLLFGLLDNERPIRRKSFNPKPDHGSNPINPIISFQIDV